MALLALLFAALVSLGQTQKSPFCDDRFTVISDAKQEDCEDGKQLFYLEDKCYPTCENVITSMAISCGGDVPCMLGYKCTEIQSGIAVDNICQLDEESCFKYYGVMACDENKFKGGDEMPSCENVYLNATWPPTCSKDGTWAATQLKGEEANGRVFCADEAGNRIFGHSWSTAAVNMTCACSRHKAKLEKDAPMSVVSLHCDGQGNYEPLQCVQGQCWCAEPKTGDLTSPVVPESMWMYLHCYNEKANGEKYLRQCESELYAQKTVLKELAVHGTTGIRYSPLMCDPDGSYGKLKVVNGQAYCTWRDGSTMDSFQMGNTEGMDCNCARDKKMYAQEGLQHNKKCVQTGNYAPVQSIDLGIGSQFYCVDSDGFQTSPMFDEPIEAFNCTIYK